MKRRTVLFVLGASVATWQQLPGFAEQSDARRAANVQVYEAPS